MRYMTYLVIEENLTDIDSRDSDIYERSWEWSGILQVPSVREGKNRQVNVREADGASSHGWMVYRTCMAGQYDLPKSLPLRTSSGMRR